MRGNNAVMKIKGLIRGKAERMTRNIVLQGTGQRVGIVGTNVKGIVKGDTSKILGEIKHFFLSWMSLVDATGTGTGTGTGIGTTTDDRQQERQEEEEEEEEDHNGNSRALHHHHNSFVG
eukprot:scaffold37_cov159-Amphora_coffeaeformis.AAC.5